MDAQLALCSLRQNPLLHLDLELKRAALCFVGKKFSSSYIITAGSVPWSQGKSSIQ